MGATDKNDKSGKKVMLVTGASRGIGAEIAVLAASQGWRVGVNYLSNEAAAQAVVARIREAGGEAVALQADVGKLPEVRRLFEQVDAQFGRLDALVNNAGVLASFRITELDEHNLADVYAANVFSHYYCAGEAARRMARQGHRRGGGHLPARGCGTGENAGRRAEQQGCDAGSLGRQRQATAGCQVQSLGGPHIQD